MIEEKLKSLNIALPNPPKPAGAYIPVVKSGNTVYVSGQIPIEGGTVVFKGKVPSVQSLEQAQKAAKLCAINALAQLKSELGSLDKISRILRVSGFVNSEPDFIDQPKVINAASDLLFEIFGEKGKHSRIAVGVVSLPLGATVEIDMIVEIN
jgi:enamine deaminase RidA (YjgF/YER057c/UK114 family)